MCYTETEVYVYILYVYVYIKVMLIVRSIETYLKEKSSFIPSLHSVSYNMFWSLVVSQSVPKLILSELPIGFK